MTYIEIIELLKTFREYEKQNVGALDGFYRRDDFLSFVSWVSQRGQYAMTTDEARDLMENVSHDA